MMDFSTLSKAWGDAALAYAQASTASLALSSNMAQEFWGVALQASRPVETQPKSWYRQPTANPFDPHTWMPSVFRSSDPWGWRGSVVRAWADAVTAQTWPGLKAPAPVVDALTVALPAFWSMAPAMAAPAAAAMSNYPAAVFSAYRSDSGHAVAQIICETMVAATRLPVPIPGFPPAGKATFF